MSRVVTISGERVSIPNNYTNGSNTAFTITSGNAMYYDSTHGSYATLKCTAANSVNDIYLIFNSTLFDDIPNTATITSISCKLKCKSNATGNNGTSATYIRGCSGTTEKGSANTTNSNTLSTRTITLGAASSWSVSDVKNFRLYIKITNGKNNKGLLYVYGADLTVSYSGDVNEYDIVSSDTSSNGDLSPIGTRSLYEGNSKIYKITTNYIDRIYLKDNGTIVNNNIVDVTATSTTSGDFYPVVFNSEDSNYNGINEGSYPVSNGCGSAGSSSETRINTNTGTGAETYFYYKFDVSNISELAVIDSISCSFKGAMSAGDNTQYYTTQDFQLCCETTPKGSSTRLTSSTATTYTMSNVGNWTREELDDLQIRFYAVRGTSLTDTTHYVRFYGATVTIQYHIAACKSYTIDNISSDHTLVLQDRPTYLITTSTSVSGASFSPTSVTVYEGNDSTFTVIIPDLSSVNFTDNNTDVTSSLSGSGTTYTYTLTNVNSTHNLVLIQSGPENALYMKVNGSFVKISHVYKKVSGQWTEVQDLTTLLSPDKIYIKS